MRVVHTVNSLRADHGGPSRSITALARTTAVSGADVSIVTHADVDPSEYVPTLPLRIDRIKREPVRELLGRPGVLTGALEALTRNEATLHDHGLWLPINRGVASYSKRRRIPRVISIRGMLSEWALSQSSLQKRLAWWAYQRDDLANAAALHVTSAMELQEVRRTGADTPVAVIANGVKVPDEPDDVHNAKKRVLFLSRIHTKKGVDHLLEAWSAVRREGWAMTIAGPEEDERLAQRVQGAAEKDASIEVIGPVADEEKWAVYRTADLFVLPTMSENFGIVIAEALASGVPVITTKAAPWQELVSHRCGWWIDTGTRPLVDAMRAAMDLSDEERRAMGARGRRLMADNYSWEEVARKMIAVYEWVLGRGSRPDWVDV